MAGCTSKPPNPKNRKGHSRKPVTDKNRMPSFFFNDTATTEIYTLSLHDALPICNAGTTPGANFIGTTDGHNLLIRGGFVGVGRANAIGSEYFGVEAPATSGNYGGMYINTTNA